MPAPADRHNFPGCRSCPYVNPGQWTVCAQCASEQLSSIKDPCPLCAQECPDGRCRNFLCTGRAGPRHIQGITAITLHNDPIANTIRRFKYEGKSGWGMIFARLLIGHLHETRDPDDIDLITANPPSPGRDHTTLVIRHAITYNTANEWPFDDDDDPALTKPKATAQSAGRAFDGKMARWQDGGSTRARRCD